MVSRSRISISQCGEDSSQVRTGPQKGIFVSKGCQTACATCLKYFSYTFQWPAILFPNSCLCLWCNGRLFLMRYASKGGGDDGAEVFDKSFVIFTAMCGVALPGVPLSRDAESIPTFFCSMCITCSTSFNIVQAGSDLLLLRS